MVLPTKDLTVEDRGTHKTHHPRQPITPHGIILWGPPLLPISIITTTINLFLYMGIYILILIKLIKLLFPLFLQKLDMEKFCYYSMLTKKFLISPNFISRYNPTYIPTDINYNQVWYIL